MVLLDMMNREFELNNAIEEMKRPETPPPPSTASLRDWFVGIALANTEIMKNVPPENVVKVAMKIADDLMSALMSPRTPSGSALKIKGVEAPVDVQRDIQEDVKRDRATMPEMRVPRRNSILPPPAIEVHSMPTFGSIELDTMAPPVSAPKPHVEAGRYSIVTPKPKAP